DEFTGSRHDIGGRRLEEAHALDARKVAVGVDGEADGRDGRRGWRAGEELGFEVYAARASAHDHGIAPGRAPASHGTIFQVAEREELIRDPSAECGVPDERNGGPLPEVPQGPAPCFVDLEPQPPGAARAAPSRCSCDGVAW